MKKEFFKPLTPICIVEHQRKLCNLNREEIQDLLDQIDEKVTLFDPIDKEEIQRREDRINFFLTKGEAYFKKGHRKFLNSKEYKEWKKLQDEKEMDEELSHFESIGEVAKPKVKQIDNTGWDE